MVQPKDISAWTAENMGHPMFAWFDGFSKTRPACKGAVDVLSVCGWTTIGKVCTIADSAHVPHDFALGVLALGVSFYRSNTYQTTPRRKGAKSETRNKACPYALPLITGLAAKRGVSVWTPDNDGTPNMLDALMDAFERHGVIGKTSLAGGKRAFIPAAHISESQRKQSEWTAQNAESVDAFFGDVPSVPSVPSVAQSA